MSDELLSSITHVIFDLDGLLVDTERIYTMAINSIAKEYGKEFTFEMKQKVMGLGPKESGLLLIQQLGLPLEWNQFMDQLDNKFSELIKDVDLMPGAERLITHLYKTNIPMAIATGSDSRQYSTKISKFYDFFTKHFSHYVLAGDDPQVKRGKPFPDVFIEAMNRFNTNLKPENVLVFEDSPLGVKAAIAAQMPVVWVPDPRVDVSQQESTLILKSLEEFRPELFGLSPFEPNDCQ